jgi:HSP20 family protein
MKMVPLRRPMFGRMWSDDLIRVDEFRDNGTLVIRAELPGIDPDKDVELTVENGMLTIAAERHDDTKVEEAGYLCREMRHGSFTRTLPLPTKVTEVDIKASYKDGILEIRVPVPKTAPTTKVAYAATSASAAEAGDAPSARAEADVRLLGERFLFDAIDARRSGAMLQPLRESCERVVAAARDDFDATIGEVHRVAVQAEFLRSRARGCTEEHALHVAADEESSTRHSATSPSTR